MAMKMFQNAYGGNASKSIAINTDHIMSVFETESINPDSGETEKLTNLFSVSGNTWQVKDSYLDVISQLNDE